MKRLYGGIEAGGTKFMCMVGTGPADVAAQARFPTTTPGDTIRRALEFFAPYAARGELAALGIASFGPVDLDQRSATYGYITTTPKPHWSGVNLCGPVQEALRVPIAFDTDVNAAAFGEQFWLPDKARLDPFLYMTVGTGIGVGVVINGSPLHGLLHAEAGHFLMPHDRYADPFTGVCPFHGDCLEGLASGLSMKTRWNQNPENLPAEHPGWDLESGYLALALVNLIYAYSPRRIILGGGVSQHAGLHEVVRLKVRHLLHGYIRSPMLDECIEEYIRPPVLENRSGGLGAIALAIRLAQGS
jgi:fructokinase